MKPNAQERPWHAVPIEEAAAHFTSDPAVGLSEKDARERLASHGPNQLPAPGRKGPLIRFLAQMNNTLIYVLIAAGVGKVFLGEWVDAGVILGVVLINSLLGFVQEGKAEKALDSIRNMLSPEAMLMRGGETRMIAATDLVPGDVVLLQSGDKVPADLRLYEIKNLRVEEAALTGESVPSEKSEEPVAENATIGDRRSMAYSGTLVVSGRAKGLVVATGASTEIGHINQMLSGVKAMETPLLRQIEHFGKILTIAILIICAMAFAYGRLFLDKDFVEMFKAVVGITFCDREEVAEGSPSPINRDFWEKENARIARRGERVLALAWRAGDGLADFTPGGLPRDFVLLGLVGIIDPPREEAIDAVRECHEGGIRVTMITGDHAITAASIAKMLGIGDGKTYVTGRELEELDDDALEAKCRRVDVFARTSPEHKLRLVRAMQASGQVVSMTGDGVNDAPALKQADVGVAMGIKGTEVSKEAAEMVLTDDNFASITAAVREGRTVFNNIEKALLFMLPTNGGQGLTILLAVLAGLTLPVTPPQILWINMVTSITLALAISFEPHELDVMRRPPRQVSRPLLDVFGLWRVAFISVLLLLFTFGTFYFLYQVRGYGLDLSRTAAVNALIVGQVFYLVNSRFLLDSCFTLRALTGNKWILISIGAIILLQILFTYAPFMNAIFGSEPMPAHFWGWLVAGGAVFFTLAACRTCDQHQTPGSNPEPEGVSPSPRKSVQGMPGNDPLLAACLPDFQSGSKNLKNMC
jgi:magnesium-transporting ATPase (P-type)